MPSPDFRAAVPGLLDSLIAEETDEQKRSARMLECFYARLTLGPLNEESPRAVRDLVEALPFPEDTQRHLLSQPEARFLLYRELVQKTHRRVLEAILPRTIARLGSSFEPLFRTFLAAQSETRRMLRELVPAFLDFGRESEPSGVEPYLWELGQLEAARVTLGAALEGPEPEALELELKRGLVLSEASLLLRFRHAVHSLPEEVEDRTVPVAVPTHLLCYRAPHHEIKYLELSPAAADLIELLSLGRTLGEAVRLSAQRNAADLSAATMDAFSLLLADLSARGVVKGPSP